MTPMPAYRMRGRVHAAAFLAALVAGLLWAAVAARGQEAQPLAYRSSDQAEEVIGLTPGQNLEWSWDPSAGLALPTFTSKRPLFARWVSPMVPGGAVQMALDPSVAGGPYDRLFLDTNVDGRLADESPIPAFSAAKNPYGQSVEFRQVPVRLIGPRGTLAYQLDLKLEIKGGEPSLMVATAGGRREGKVTIDGRTLTCMLIDTNANGTFNDRGEDLSGGDVICVGDPSALQVAPVTDYIEVSEKLFGLEVAQDGSFVKFVSLEKRGLGFLRMPPDIARVALSAGRRRLVLDAQAGRTPVPAGSYRVDAWLQVRRDSSGAVWRWRRPRAGYRPPCKSSPAGAPTWTWAIRSPPPCRLAGAVPRPTPSAIRGSSAGSGRTWCSPARGAARRHPYSTLPFMAAPIAGRSGSLVHWEAAATRSPGRCPKGPGDRSP